MGTLVGLYPGCGEMENLDGSPIYGGLAGSPPMKVDCPDYSPI
jgi:hypothetical protein